MNAAPRLRGRPERIFVSVDESTGKSTVSFMPPDVGSPLQLDDDKMGEVAMKEAKSLAEKYPGCTVHGPHVQAARPVGRWKARRRPAAASGEQGGGGGGASSDSED
jgi:hypothetical protein